LPASGPGFRSETEFVVAGGVFVAGASATARDHDKVRTRANSRTDLPTLQIIAFKFENDNITWTYCSKNCSEILDSPAKSKQFHRKKAHIPNCKRTPRLAHLNFRIFSHHHFLTRQENI
jgi:hypothetical protein